MTVEWDLSRSLSCGTNVSGGLRLREHNILTNNFCFRVFALAPVSDAAFRDLEGDLTRQNQLPIYLFLSQGLAFDLDFGGVLDGVLL